MKLTHLNFFKPSKVALGKLELTQLCVWFREKLLLEDLRSLTKQHEAEEGLKLDQNSIG